MSVCLGLSAYHWVVYSVLLGLVGVCRGLGMIPIGLRCVCNMNT